MIAKKGGLPFNNLQALAECKEHFLSLCKMYDHSGKLHLLHSKELQHPQFARTSLPQTHQRLLDQYAEIGEELKNIGTILDLLGGSPVMKPAESEPVPLPEPPKSPDIPKKKAAKKKVKKVKKKAFVDNKAPKKGKKEK